MTMYSSFNCGQLPVFLGISFALLLANAFPQDLSSSSESTDKESLNISNEPNDIKFLLFPDALNSNDSEEITFDDLASLTESSFVPHIQTILITHGFRSDANSPSCQNVKNALLSYSSLDANIIIVDWKALATPTPISYALNWYTHVLANVPIVGERIGKFINFLKDKNVIELESIYLIGHSLGAHVMGKAGKLVQEDFNDDKVGRITGLDPALVGYWPENKDKNLEKADASFVDVIHTNAGLLGVKNKCGHADFYPNGGSHQPGCEIGDHSVPHALPGLCSHEYSHILYAESVFKNFYACPCEREPFTTAYMENICSNDCNHPAIMGFHCAPTTEGAFYLDTSSEIPSP